MALRARDYLHAHMDQDLGLDDLARATGVDRFRLSRAFKAAFGLAPHMRRFNYAMALLLVVSALLSL